jgi:hypothetical protein
MLELLLGLFMGLALGIWVGVKCWQNDLTFAVNNQADSITNLEHKIETLTMHLSNEDER